MCLLFIAFLVGAIDLEVMYMMKADLFTYCLPNTNI